MSQKETSVNIPTKVKTTGVGIGVLPFMSHTGVVANHEPPPYLHAKESLWSSGGSSYRLGGGWYLQPYRLNNSLLLTDPRNEGHACTCNTRLTVVADLRLLAPHLGNGVLHC